MNLKNSTFVHVCFRGTTVNITAFSIFGEITTSWTCEAPPSSPASPSLLAKWIVNHGSQRQGDSRLPTVYIFFDAPPEQDVSTFIRMFGTVGLFPYIIGPARVKDLSRGLLFSGESVDTILRACNEAQLVCQLMYLASGYRTTNSRDDLQILKKLVVSWTEVHKI